MVKPGRRDRLPRGGHPEKKPAGVTPSAFLATAGSISGAIAATRVCRSIKQSAVLSGFEGASKLLGITQVRADHSGD
jgi:hypothetical protein